MDENTQLQQPTIDNNSATSSMERRPPLGEDPAAMTIEFLRARLLSERSVSKAARQHAQQLAQKVLELECRLESEIQLREKFESVRLEALSTYKDELISEYGHFFVSDSGEDSSDRTAGGRNEVNSATVASAFRDVDFSLEPGRTDGESPVQPNQEGALTGRMANLEVNRSSRQESLEDHMNKGSSNDDEEVELIGREKGILAWSRRKGDRRQQDKERGNITELFGRSFSHKSFAGLSADGESPQKRWIGKSVRQIRRRENRLPEVNSEDGHCQLQEAEDVDGKISNPEAMKESIRCDADVDTEVERVLERQAELIERYEAEENAQMAWEEKFRQQIPSPLSSSRDQDNPPNRSEKEKSVTLVVTDGQKAEEESACGLTGADEHISNQLAEDDVTLQTQNVYLEDSSCNNIYLAAGKSLSPLEIAHKATSEGSSRAVNECKDSVEVQLENSFCRMTHLTEEKSFSHSQTRQKVASEDSSRAGDRDKDLGTCSTNESSNSSNSLQGHCGPLMAGMEKLFSEKSTEERKSDFEEPERNCTIELASGMMSQVDPSHDKVGKMSHKQGLQMDDPELIQKGHENFKESQGLSTMVSGEVSENEANLSNRDIQGREIHMRDPSLSHEGTSSPDLCNKQLSSFKFSASHDDVSMLGEVVVGSTQKLLDLPARSTPHDNFSVGLTMPNAVHEVRGQGHERISGSGETCSFSTSEFNWNTAGKSGNDQTFQNLSSPLNQHALNRLSSDRINVTQEVDLEESVDTKEAIIQSPCGDVNGDNDGASSHASSDNMMKDSPWEEIFRRRMRAQESRHDHAGQTKNSYGLRPYPDFSMQPPLHAPAQREGMKLDNLYPLWPSRTVMPDYYGPQAYGSGSYYQDKGGRINHHKSLDGSLDRVTEVLRVLQIAKHQIQCSDQSAKIAEDLDTSNKRGFDGREAFYVQPADGHPVLSHMNLDGPTSCPALPPDVPPSGHFGPRLNVDSPCNTGREVPPHFAMPGRAPYYSSLYGRGFTPLMSDMRVRPAAGYARSPASFQNPIPWAPQETHIRNAYHHDPRNQR